ncbi:metal-dependent hydrolase [Bacillus cereus]|nr:metal-dependent hydrolase [Bacillus cereus]
MEIAKGVEMLQLKFQEFIIHPILLWNDEMAVLIDTGFPGQFEDIQVEMERVGVSVDKLKVVILTHQDIDHIGSLPDVLENGVFIYACSIYSVYNSL